MVVIEAPPVGRQGAQGVVQHGVPRAAPSRVPTTSIGSARLVVGSAIVGGGVSHLAQRTLMAAASG